MPSMVEEQCLMRLFIGESDSYGHHPLSEALLDLFRRHSISGVTILRGIAGYGARNILHTDRLLELSQDLPIILEVVESRDTIDRLMPELDRIMNSSGMVTLEMVEVIRYRDAGADVP